MREIWWAEANGWNANALFSGTREAKIFRDAGTFQSLLMKGRFSFDMDRPFSTSWWPETSKLIFVPFGSRSKVWRGDFFEPNQTVFLFMEERSSITVHII
jgi:hypothetical protein